MTFTEKLRGLLEKATPGPWERREGRYGYDIQTKKQYQITLAKDLFEYNIQTVLLLVNAAPALVRLLNGMEYLAEYGSFNAGPLENTISLSVWARKVLDELDKEAER